MNSDNIPATPSPEQKMREAIRTAALAIIETHSVPSVDSQMDERDLPWLIETITPHVLSALQSSGCLKAEGAATPETDVSEFYCNVHTAAGRENMKMVPADFARKLEQQRDALKRENATLTDVLSRARPVDISERNELLKLRGIVEADISTIEGLRASLAQAQRERDEYKVTVDRVWGALGVRDFLGAGGKTIWELVSIRTAASQEVEELKAENVTLRNAQKACEDCMTPTYAELKRDKERLDWLEDEAREIWLRGEDATAPRRKMAVTIHDIRMSIDAARLADKGTEERK